MKRYSTSNTYFDEQMDTIKLSSLAEEALKHLIVHKKDEKILQFIEGSYERRVGVLVLSADELMYYGIQKDMDPLNFEIPFYTVLNILSVEKDSSTVCDIKILTQTHEFVVSSCNIEQCRLFIENAENIVEQDFDFYFL